MSEVNIRHSGWDAVSGRDANVGRRRMEMGEVAKKDVSSSVACAVAAAGGETRYGRS